MKEWGTQILSDRQCPYNVVMMTGRVARWGAAVTWLVLVTTAGLRAQVPLTIQSSKLEPVTLGSNVAVAIQVAGGAQPLTWTVTGGKLPPGLSLGATQGVITGTPTRSGSYDFEVTVTDSSVRAMQMQRTFTLIVTAALSIEWKQPPAVHGQNLEGSVIVTNQTAQEFTLTVIVMAVNQIGRATALGYQELTLQSGGEQVIPFGASPGPATYAVHADAVAEVLSTNTIYRARKQTVDPLVIQAPQ